LIPVRRGEFVDISETADGADGVSVIVHRIRIGSLSLRLIRLSKRLTQKQERSVTWTFF
jgi:hypothetical protein